MLEPKVVKEALPLTLLNDGGKAVIIVHGFRGYPGEFYSLANQLHDKGYNVFLPRLPGHGTFKEDFEKTNWNDWLKHIEDLYFDISYTYECVDIIGLSMGGLISTILASKYKFNSLTLLAPAMAFEYKAIRYTPFLQHFMKVHASDPWTASEGDSEDIKRLGREYWSWNFPKQAAGLYKLKRIAEKSLSGITCPTLLMLSEKDEQVTYLEASKIYTKGLKNCKLDNRPLKESHHVLVTGCEKELVFTNIFDFLNC